MAFVPCEHCAAVFHKGAIRLHQRDCLVTETALQLSRTTLDDQIPETGADPSRKHPSKEPQELSDEPPEVHDSALCREISNQFTAGQKSALANLSPFEPGKDQRITSDMHFNPSRHDPQTMRHVDAPHQVFSPARRVERGTMLTSEQRKALGEFGTWLSPT